VKRLRSLRAHQARGRSAHKRAPVSTSPNNRFYLLDNKSRLERKIEGQSLPLLNPASSKKRHPATGQLIGLERSRGYKRFHCLKASITSLKKYLRSRIEKGVFEPLSRGEVPSKMDLRRLTVWLQPIRVSQPSKTEVRLFNSRMTSINSPHRLGTGAILIPGSNNRTLYDFFKHPNQFGILKKRILHEWRIPKSLLEILHWL